MLVLFVVLIVVAGLLFVNLWSVFKFWWFGLGIPSFSIMSLFVCVYFSVLPPKKAKHGRKHISSPVSGPPEEDPGRFKGCLAFVYQGQSWRRFCSLGAWCLLKECIVSLASPTRGAESKNKIEDHRVGEVASNMARFGGLPNDAFVAPWLIFQQGKAHQEKNNACGANWLFGNEAPKLFAQLRQLFWVLQEDRTTHWLSSQRAYTFMCTTTMSYSIGLFGFYASLYLYACLHMLCSLLGCFVCLQKCTPAIYEQRIGQKIAVVQTASWNHSLCVQKWGAYVVQDRHPILKRKAKSIFECNDTPSYPGFCFASSSAKPQ